MGFFSSIRKWFSDKTGFPSSKESLKRKHDKCETINNKRARMDDSLVEVVEISDESLSEVEEVEITEPGPSTIPLRASPPVMLIDGRRHQRRNLSQAMTVDLTASDDENELKFMKSYSISDSKIMSNRTSGIVRSTSSKSCLFEPMKYEDKYSQKFSSKSNMKPSLSMEDRISALHVSCDSSVNNNKDHSFAMILKNYVLPKSDDFFSNPPDAVQRKSPSNNLVNKNTDNSIFKNYVSLKLEDIDRKDTVKTPCQSVNSSEIKESVLNQSNLSNTSSKQKLDALKLQRTTSNGSLKNFNESVLNQSNSSRTSDKENLDIPGLSLNKNRVINNEMFYERILRKFREKQATTILDPVSITQRTPDEIFQEKLENLNRELETLEPSKKIDVFPEYSQKVLDLIDRTISGSSNDYIFQGKNIRISDLRTVYSPQSWLNDEVINHYLHMIVDRDPISLHTFDTFFYTKLSSQGYEAVRRWSRKKDIFSCKKMLSPIHLGNHWCLICVNFTEKSVTYYDSLGGKNPKCLNTIFDYLKQEHLNKKNEELDISGWRLIEATNCPKQKNGYDCGVFTCINAEYLARDAKLDFTQDDMPKLRKRICYEIISNQLCF